MASDGFIKNKYLDPLTTNYIPITSCTLGRLTSQAAKCLSDHHLLMRRPSLCKALQNGSDDQIKGSHLHAPAQFSISELAPVGGLIGLERGTSRGWRDARYD